jgi:oxalate decarboxylase
MVQPSTIAASSISRGIDLNVGNEPLRFLELFRASHYEDVSLAQWMALTPHELVQAHLELDRKLIDEIRKQKQPVV